MPKIDLFDKTADETKIFSAIQDGTFRFRSKQYAKYLLKCTTEGAIIGTVIGLAIVGALAIAVDAIASTLEEEVTE